jgi:Tol biopolymer transport system component
MTDLREVFEMTTKQVEPDVDAWGEQEHRQRRSTRNRKIGGFAAAAAIALAAVGVILATRSQPRTTVPGDQPSSPASSPKAVPRMSVPFVLDLSTGAATPLAKGVPTQGRGYAVSPDRTMVATGPCCDHPAPVWVAYMDGSGVFEFTPEGVDGFGPRWSPDGSRLVYQERTAATEELGNLVVVNLGGSCCYDGSHWELRSGDKIQVTDLPPKSYGLWFLSPSFTPDGQAILFQLPKGPGPDPEGWDLWSVPVTGGKATLVLRDAATGAYSPDGRSLAYGNPSPGDWTSDDLLIADENGDNPRVLVHGIGIEFPKWSPDSTRIAYVHSDGVYVVDVATGKTSRVAIGDFPEWFDNDTLIIAPQ